MISLYRVFFVAGGVRDQIVVIFARADCIVDYHQ